MSFQVGEMYTFHPIPDQADAWGMFDGFTAVVTSVSDNGERRPPTPVGSLLNAQGEVVRSDLAFFLGELEGPINETDSDAGTSSERQIDLGQVLGASGPFFPLAG